MTKEEFTAILKEYDFPDHLIDELWDNRPPDIELTEEIIKGAAEHVLPFVANHITKAVKDD